MRTFILAFALIVATSTMAGQTPDSIPNIGLFAALDGAPAANIVVASR